MENALTQKGFRCDNTHHQIFWFYVGERKTSIRTRFSHGTREYNQGLLSQVRKQIKLQTKDEFDSFMDCPMTYLDYLKKMVERKEVVESQPMPASPPSSKKRSKK